MIAATAYLHYWFVHSNIEIQNFNTAKEAVLQKMSSQYGKRQTSIINRNTNADEMLKIYEDMKQGNILGQSLSQEIGQAYSQRLTSGSDTGIGYSFAQIGLWNSKMKKQKNKEGLELAKKLVNELGTIIKNTQDLLDDLANTLEKNYPIAHDYALKVMCEGQYGNFFTRGAAAGRKLVQDTLSEGGGIKWITTSLTGDELALAKDYVRLKQRLEALKVLSGTQTGYADITKGEFSSKIIGKIGGTLNNVSGRTEEIALCAAAGALLETEGQLAKMLPKGEAFAGVTGGGGFLSVQTTEKQSAEFKDLLNSVEKGNQATFNKNDVSIVYSSGGVITAFGISAKVSNASSKTKSGKAPIKIHDTSLASILNLAKTKDGSTFTDFMTYNLAAGNTNSDVSELKAPSGVYAMWKSYVDYAIALNTLDYLAGDASLYSNNVLLIANGNVYSIDQVLQQIGKNPSALSRAGKGAFAAQRFVSYNTWVGAATPGTHRNEQQANQRSENVISTLESVFQSIKIQIKLDLDSLILTSL